MTWHTEKLGRLAEFRNGVNFSRSNYGKGIKVIGVADFQNYSVPKFDQLGEIDPQGIVHTEDLLKEDDIVFVRSNGNRALIGRSLHIKNLRDKVTHSGFTIRLRFVSPSIFVPFYVQLFKSEHIRREISYLGSGTNISNLSQETLKNISVPLPPIPEQKKIAQILYTWDEAIDKTEQLIAALQERKRGLVQRLLTGEVRLPGFERSKAKQKNRYGEIPIDWGYIPVGEIAKHVSVKNIKGENLPVLSCTKYEGLVDSLKYFGRQMFSEDTSTYKIVQRGQFAYATNHIEEGSIGYQNLYDSALISPMYTVFEPNEKIDDGFLYKLLKTELFRHIFEINTSASVDRRGSLRWNVFAQIEIPLPSMEEQKAIAQVLDTCDQEIVLTSKYLGAVKQHKKGLMQRLLTGQVRVKV